MQCTFKAIADVVGVTVTQKMATQWDDIDKKRTTEKLWKLKGETKTKRKKLKGGNLAHFMEVTRKSKRFLSVNVSKISKKHFYSTMQEQFSRGVPMKRCSEKYASNLQEKTHAEVWFQ